MGELGAAVGDAGPVGRLAAYFAVAEELEEDLVEHVRLVGLALVAALGRGDRTRALEIMDTLSKEGEYMPLALTFLGTQFRMALVAREAGLKSAGQVQQHFTRLGVPMWGSRADQVYASVSKFHR